MKFIRPFQLLLVLSLSLSAQAPANDKNVNELTDSTQKVLAYRHRGGPSYNVDVGHDGTVVYEGIGHVKIKGKVVTKIAREQMRELLMVFTNANFFQLQDSYNRKSGCTSGETEGPWISITLRRGGRIKTIDHDLGCDWGSKKYVSGFKQLERLESAITRILNIEQWIGTEDERGNLLKPLAVPRQDYR